MKKWIIVLTMTALVCGFPGQPAADTFTSTLNTLGTTFETDFPNLTNYGTVTVNRTSDTHATVTFSMLESPYDFDFLSIGAPSWCAWINVAGTVSDPSSDTFGWQAQTGSYTNIDGLGNFDVRVGRYPLVGSVEGFTITLDASGATKWADAASVLECNAVGFDAAAFVAYHSSICNPTGYVGESCPVPLPGAFLLLGAGLARMTAYARRKRRV